jgi:hypothetical protein
LPADYVLAIYAYLNDAVVITRNTSAAFLQALQRWQHATQPNSTLDVQPFVEVARDMLAYFRYRWATKQTFTCLRHSNVCHAAVPVCVGLVEHSAACVSSATALLKQAVLLCCRYSEALLVLLRQFSQSGALVPTAVNPDVLQREIQQLLNTTNLNSYYAAVAQSCGHDAKRGFLQVPEPAADEALDAADAATGVTQVKVGKQQPASGVEV